MTAIPDDKITTTWVGPFYKGAMRHWREAKRAEADRRSQRTAPERRRAHAREQGYNRNSDYLTSGTSKALQPTTNKTAFGNRKGKRRRQGR